MTFFRFMERMNLWAWVSGLLLFHLLLYYGLGTPNWFYVALLAAGTWAVGLYALKAISRYVLREKDPI